MRTIEILDEDELEKIFSIGKAIHYEETVGKEYLTDYYYMTGKVPDNYEDVLEYLNKHHRTD